MDKKILVAALLGVAGSAAYAQTNVQIYGTVDTGYVKETGSDVRMDENATNLIGFKGAEDLGGGYKATFRLEKQFSLSDGTNKHSDDTVNTHDSLAKANGSRSDNIDWVGAANVGIEGAFGQVRLGRVNEMSVEYFTEIDPFEQGTTGSSLAQYNLTRSEQISNTLRYDSPEWAGFSFGLTYTLGGDKHARDDAGKKDTNVKNDGFGASLRYDNDDLFLTANFTRVADSKRSFVWNVGSAYTINDFRISLGYQASQIKDISAYYDGVDGLSGPIFDYMQGLKQQEWEIGLSYGFGANTVKFAYNRAVVDAGNHADYEGGNVNKYALGYTYDFSKRTQFYGVVSYTDSSNADVGAIYNNNGAASDSVTGVQFGITHNF